MSVRILVEPSDYLLDNAGDAAMLRVGLSRLRAHWPDAYIQVFSDAPDRFPRWVDGVVPMGVEGRQAWLHQPLLRHYLPPRTPPRLRSGVVRLERYLRRSRPAVAHSLLVRRSRRCGEDPAALNAFLTAVSRADLVVTTGMGGISDAFAPYARALLQVLELAQDRGAVTALMGQGLGPLDEGDLRSQAAAVLRRVDLIALRERRAGPRLLQRMGVDPARIVVTGDDAIEAAYSARPREPGSALGINVRAAPYAGVEESVLDRLRPAVRRLCEELAAPPVPIAISSVAGEQDLATVRRLLPADATRAVRSAETGLFESIGRCRLVVAGSYHAAVFALSMGVPAVGLYRSPYYRDKFLGLADMFGDGCRALSLDEPRFEALLLETAQSAWRQADQHRSALLEAAASQIERSRAAYGRLKAVVDGRRGSRPA